MLRITLYKNCILNETYQNVISTGTKSNSTVLELYLDRLQSKQINDIDFVYQETEGTLIFDYKIDNGNIYDYNYMKVECYNDEDETLLFKRYCFIQDIRLNNDCVYLDYEEDIWSSYSGKITKITESYLSRSRVLNYFSKNITLRTLPEEYNGNEKPTINSENNSLFYVIANVQYYNSSAYGQSTRRFYKTFLLGFEPSGWPYPQEEWVEHKSMPLDYVTGMANFLNSMQSAGRFHYLNEEYYYRIENYKIIPYNILSLFESTEFAQIRMTGVISIFHIVHLYECTLNSKYNLNSIKTYTVTNNFKRLSIGTFNNQIPVVNNGTNLDIEFKLWLEDAGINIFMYIENQIIDITEDFTYTVPFDEIEGEKNSLYNTQRHLKNIEYVAQTALNIISGGKAIAINNGIKNDISSNINSLLYTPSGKITSSKKKLNTIEKLRKGSSYYDEKILNEKIGMGKESISGIMNLIRNNLPYYTSNQGNFAKSDALLNVIFGLCDMQISSDNDNYVKKMINNTGYVVYEYTTNLNDFDIYNADYFSINNINYNVIMFETINVIGEFPRRVALILNSILENGIKIWYNENLQEDNVVVG